MLELNDLLKSAEGRDFLEANSVFISVDDFVTALERPTHTGLVDHFGVNHTTKLVYTGQQIYADYKQSVLSKIVSLQKLNNRDDIFSFINWMDTDRCGSDRLSTGFTLPIHDKQHGLNLVSNGSKNRETETRFVMVETSKVSQPIKKLGQTLTQSVSDKSKRQQVKMRYEQIQMIIEAEELSPLRSINSQLTALLFSQTLRFNPKAIFVSDILNQELVTETVNLCLNHIDHVISVFNTTIQDLLEANINAQVRPLDETYLPLFYSCDVDQRRIKLHRQIDGQAHYAIGRCKCGTDYRFYLGSQTLTIDELTATQRWSPDVLTPIFFNDLVSGYVAGKSSALYGLVLNEVLIKVLGKRPVPMLVPEDLENVITTEQQVDSLMYRYLMSDE